MLALTRKKGESIMIGSNVELIVLSVQGDQVRLGINAPRSTAVHRKEVFEQIQAENQAASSQINLSGMKRLHSANHEAIKEAHKGE
jgi:carbon storage regulator